MDCVSVDALAASQPYSMLTVLLSGLTPGEAPVPGLRVPSPV